MTGREVASLALSPLWQAVQPSACSSTRPNLWCAQIFAAGNGGCQDRRQIAQSDVEFMVEPVTPLRSGPLEPGGVQGACSCRRSGMTGKRRVAGRSGRRPDGWLRLRRDNGRRTDPGRDEPGERNPALKKGPARTAEGRRGRSWRGLNMRSHSRLGRMVPPLEWACAPFRSASNPPAATLAAGQPLGL